MWLVSHGNPEGGLSSDPSSTPAGEDRELRICGTLTPDQSLDGRRVLSAEGGTVSPHEQSNRMRGGTDVTDRTAGPRPYRTPYNRAPRLDQPREARRILLNRPHIDPDTFGRFAENFARKMGTAKFLVYMTVFVILWVLWNTLAPRGLVFDKYAFIFLTLILSLQASYAAPLILLAQNRQTDRDRVALEQDRASNQRNLADTEFLTREVASLRIALRDMATRDFLRSELRSIVEELEQRGIQLSADGPAPVSGEAPPGRFRNRPNDVLGARPEA